MSRGMAVVTFESTEHAALARSKYNGKVVDGSKSRITYVLAWRSYKYFLL